MPDDVKLPGGAHVDKKVAIGAVVVLLAIAGVYYYRQKQAAATATPAPGSANIDPQTGYAYGSPEDQAALAAQSGGTLPTYDSASSVGGQVIGYDQYGNPVYGQGGGGGSPGPGSYTSNAQWSQMAEAAMGSTGADAIAAALGKYLLGLPLTTDQVTSVQQAIASQGFPPVPGSDGFPPSYKTASTPPPPQGGVTVPSVTGVYGGDAHAKLEAAGFKWTDSRSVPANKRGLVTAQSPRARSNAKKGSTVHLTLRLV